MEEINKKKFNRSDYKKISVKMSNMNMKILINDNKKIKKLEIVFYWIKQISINIFYLHLQKKFLAHYQIKMKNIAIIGAGISGLFLANLLEKNKSFSYKIYEKKNVLDLSDGYGIQLSVNSIKLLNAIGFKNINVSDVCYPKKVNFFNAKKLKKICDIDISKFNFNNNYYTTLKRSKLIEFLLNNIPKEKIIFNSDLINIDEQARLKLFFRNNNKEEFDYLVAADGVYSKTKEILFNKDGLPKFINSIALRGNIRNFENNDISIYLGPNFHFVIYPINQNKEFNFISIIRKKLIEEEMSNRDLFNDNTFIENLLNQISSKSKFNLYEKVDEIKCFPIFVSKKFKISTLKNIFLTGDAFFSFPPLSQEHHCQ